MAIYADTAICLRRLDYSEHSQILTLFGREHGLVRVIAKGLKRSTKTRVTVGVDLLEMGGVTWSAGPGAAEGRLSVLREWRQIDVFANLRHSLGAVAAGEYAAELLPSLLAEADPHPPLFDVLCKFLSHIGRGKDNAAALVRFMWLALHYAGHLPQWQRCAVCGRPADERMGWFGLDLGGPVCDGCAAGAPDRVKVDAVLAGLLRVGRPQRAAASAFGLLDAYITYMVGRPLRSSGAVRSHLVTARGRRGEAAV